LSKAGSGSHLDCPVTPGSSQPRYLTGIGKESMEENIGRGYFFLAAMAGIMVLLLSTILWRRAENRRQIKKADDFQKRTKMLQNLPQCPLDEVKQVIACLGWIRMFEDSIAKPGDHWGEITLPPKDFSTMAMIGQTVGTIIEHWEEITTRKDAELYLDSLAPNMIESLAKVEIAIFLEGMRTNHPEATNRLEVLLTENQNLRHREQEVKIRQKVNEEGLRAAGVVYAKKYFED
jgi:hypothetical protein